MKKVFAARRLIYVRFQTLLLHTGVYGVFANLEARVMNPDILRETFRFLIKYH